MYGRYAAIAAVLITLPLGAAAQTSRPPTQNENGSATNQQQQTQAALSTGADAEGNRWIASGFVGSNFANNADPASLDLGGSIAFLAKNQFGVEFEMGFTPDFELQNDFFGLGIKPQVNSFMANAIWAKPVGTDGRWQPFISGGAGALMLRSGLSGDDPIAGTPSPNDTRFGGNVGGGLMGFSGNWGFKADVRYYRATGSYNVATSTPEQPGSPTMPPPGGYTLAVGAPGAVSAPVIAANPQGTNRAAPDSLAAAALAGLHFWRANVGLALRW